MRDPQAESNVSVVVVCVRVVLACQEMGRGDSYSDRAGCSTMHVYTPRGCNKPEQAATRSSSSSTACAATAVVL